VEDFGAPTYPELVLVTTPEVLAGDRAAVEGAVEAIEQGYRDTVRDPAGALDDLLAAVPELDAASQAAQLEELRLAFGETRSLDRAALDDWARWDQRFGIVGELPDVEATFDFEVASAGE
jgi:ABC-type nitrate/sulfonate/bicarbonate transport system substrate-binding protein